MIKEYSLGVIDEEPHLDNLQEYLLDGYFRWAGRRRKSRASEREFARYLGVKATSLSAWLSGGRGPDFANSVILSRFYGPKIFDIMGYPRVYEINDDRLQYIFDVWRDLEHDQRIEIADFVRRSSGDEGADESG